MRLRFHLWNEWDLGLVNCYDGNINFFSISWTRDVDFWGFKIIIFNFAFSWHWRKK